MDITDYLAIYGAFLSTIIFGWDIRRSLLKVRVEIINAIDNVDGKSKVGVGVSVQNLSNRVVHITNVSLLFEHKLVNSFDRFKHILKFKRFQINSGWCHTHLSNYNINDNCPVALEPGQSHWVFIPEGTIEEVLEGGVSRKLRAVAQDALWRDKYSKKFEYLN